jgi:hypothetical protein
VKHKKIFRILAVVFSLALLLMAIPASPALAVGETIAVNPDEGTIGDEFDITGTGSLGVWYDIYFSSQAAVVGDDLDDEVTAYEFLTSATINELSMEFEGVTGEVPESLTDGADDEDVHGGVYYIYMTREEDEDIKAKDTFMVTGIAQAEIDIDEGPVGTEVEITGEGFAPDEDITVEYNNDDITDEVDEPYADEDGGILLTFLIPESTFGEHTIEITGEESLAELELTFTVEPDMTITPTEGEPGTLVTVNGTGFAKRNGVYFSFGGSPITVVWLVESGGRTNSDGSFAVQFTVSEDVATGNYTVLAEDEDNDDISAQMTFTVIEVIPPLNPAITISPTSGNISDSVEVNGDEFPPDEDFTVEYDATDVTADIVGASTTDSDGELSFYLDIPESTAGEHTIKVSIEALEIEVEAVVTVEPKITIDLTTAPAGTEVKVTGTGFGYRSDITVEFDGNDVYIESGDDRSNIYGSFEFRFIVPAVAPGTYDLLVEDEDVNQAEAEFTVLTSSATISPTTGIGGTEVTVSGTDFIAYSTVSIKYCMAANATTGDVEEFTTTAGSDGLVSATFNVPASEGGNHSITISDGTNSVTANLVVLAEATISSTSGSVGDDVVVSGKGFKANATVTVTYTSESKKLTTTTNETGYFSVTLTIPASAGGAHTITVSDGVNTKQFTFTMETTPPPTPQQLLPLGNSKPEQPITFDWADVTDLSLPVTYGLQIATDANYADIVLEKLALDTSEYTLTEEEELEPVGKNEPYYWRVRATDAASNNSDWGPSGTFYIGGGWPGWLMWLWIGLGAVIIFIFAIWLGRRVAFSSY